MNELGGVESFAVRLKAYDGELLDDLYGLSPSFDDWLLMERPRLRDIVVSTALGVAGTAFEKKDFTGVRAILM